MARRRRFSAEFKARVARDAMRDVDTVNAVAARHAVDPGLVRDWRRHAEANMKNAFGSAPKAEANQDAIIKCLHAQIGEVTICRSVTTSALAADETPCAKKPCHLAGNSAGCHPKHC